MVAIHNIKETLDGYLFNVIGLEEQFYTTTHLPQLTSKEFHIIDSFKIYNRINIKIGNMGFNGKVPYFYTTNTHRRKTSKLNIIRTVRKPKTRTAVKAGIYILGKEYNGKVILAISSRWKQKSTGRILEYIYKG